MSCANSIIRYEQEYLSSYRCAGPDDYLMDVVDFLEEQQGFDNWDQQIACVLAGRKKVAMTDYDSYEDPDIDFYYEQHPKNETLRDTALSCGVQLLHDKKGTSFYFFSPI